MGRSKLGLGNFKAIKSNFCHFEGGWNSFLSFQGVDLAGGGYSHVKTCMGMCRQNGSFFARNP